MASKRRLKRRACERKIKHKSRGAAFAAIKAMWLRYGTGARGVQPYRCSHCGAWHVGHEPGSKGNRVAAVLDRLKKS